LPHASSTAGYELNSSYPVTGHKTDDRFTKAVGLTEIRKFTD